MTCGLVTLVLMSVKFSRKVAVALTFRFSA